MVHYLRCHTGHMPPSFDQTFTTTEHQHPLFISVFHFVGFLRLDWVYTLGTKPKVRIGHPSRERFFTVYPVGKLDIQSTVFYWSALAPLHPRAKLSIHPLGKVNILLHRGKAQPPHCKSSPSTQPFGFLDPMNPGGNALGFSPCKEQVLHPHIH